MSSRLTSPAAAAGALAIVVGLVILLSLGGTPLAAQPQALGTPTHTATPAPTFTPTLTPTPTPTDTPTPTPTPTRTPVPGAPDTAAPSTGAGLPAAGGSWESIFLQGFIAAVLLVVLLTAFIIVILVILLVVWRIMRMRRAEGQL